MRCSAGSTRINGETHYLARAVDHEGLIHNHFNLDSPVVSTR
jgi:hypothetical protein